MSNLSIAQFYQQTLKAVKSLPIAKVAETRMKTKRSGKTVLAVCPYHHDERVGSFVLGGRTKGFKCFACGEAGTNIDLIMKLDKVPFMTALFRIALEFEIVEQKQVDDYFESKNEIAAMRVARENGEVNREQLDKFLKNKKEFKFDYDYKKNVHEFKENWHDSREVSDEKKEIINNVYEIFSNGNALIKKDKLSEKHMKLLKEERQLSEEDIAKHGFFTFPSRDILDVFYIFLRAHHDYKPDVLKSVPGFYGLKNEYVSDDLGYLKLEKDEKVHKMVFSEMEGIGIPIRDEKGNILAIQVRLDNKKDGGMRYIWFSSSWAIDKEELVGGATAGAPKDVTYPDKIKNTTVFVTEGKFKAIQIAKKFGSIAISIQGVSSWRGLEGLLEAVQNEVKDEVKLNHLMIAYDGDMFTNAAVMQQTVNLSDQVHEVTDFDVNIAVWDTDDGAGIDDLILNGFIHKLKSHSYDKFKEVYDKFADKINEHFDPKKKGTITVEMKLELKEKMLNEFK